MKCKCSSIILSLAMVIAAAAPAAMASISGAIYTSKADGTTVNANLYDNKNDVYLNGGPQNQNAGGLSPLGTYYFQVTDPSGSVLLSTDPAACRQVVVAPSSLSGKGVIFGVPAGAPPAACTNAGGNWHSVGGNPPGTPNADNGSLPVQLMPFSNTPNNGGEYKVWLISQSCATISESDPRVLQLSGSCDTKTDNFKVKQFVCEHGVGPFPFPPPNGPDTCFAVMPVHKTIAGRTPVCDSPSVEVGNPDQNGNVTTIETTHCADDVVGSVDRVCTIVTNGTTLISRSCVAENVDFLNVFQADLFLTANGQPMNFPNSLAQLYLPPTEDPLAPQNQSFTICEVNIPAGWHLPDDGVSTSTDGGDPVPVPVYTPVDSLTDRNRCWNVTIPEADTFEIFVNNVPTGSIRVTKNTVGGDGTFSFAGSGGGDCDDEVEGLDLCTGLAESFNITTTGGTGTYTPDFTVEARTEFPNLAELPPYGVTEVGAGGSVPGSLSDWVRSVSCSDGTDTVSNTAFGVAPAGLVTCTFTNIRKPQLQVIKAVDPTDDPGTCTLFINGSSDGQDGTGHGAYIGPKTVEFGSNTVGEAGSGSTLLSDYNTSISCTDGANPVSATGGVLLSNGRTWTLNLTNPEFAGKTVVCTITNVRKRVGQRTLGYWANWNSCSGGGQTQANANPPEFWLDLYIGQVSVGTVLMDTCPHAVNILRKQDFSGVGMASDGAYNMAAQLLAAKLNVLAGAGQCDIANQAIAAGDALLVAIGFTAQGPFLPSGRQPLLIQQRRAYANTLASILDQYNNLEHSGKSCSDIVPSSLPPAP